MNREYHKWWSSRLNRDMELLVFGHAGQPVLVFPTSMGKFYEYEDRGMVGAIAGQIEQGHVQLFCVDSVDTESWYCKWAHPSGRVWRHIQYEDYILNEVLPLMRQRSGRRRVAVTGASFGGFHCTNFALRHPDCVSHCISMSGAYDIHPFLDGYWDDNCYFNCPTAFVPNTDDPWYLGQYRSDIRWIFAAGEHDICRAANEQISGIFHAKGIPHWYDFWGLGAVHDWPLWREMARKYFT
ncbi:MAG: esterase family protein [Bryobacteraceae bacterium]|nr:esterase family protein [Bryobacteraceae bacterium]